MKRQKQNGDTTAFEKCRNTFPAAVDTELIFWHMEECFEDMGVSVVYGLVDRACTSGCHEGWNVGCVNELNEWKRSGVKEEVRKVPRRRVIKYKKEIAPLSHSTSQCLSSD